LASKYTSFLAIEERAPEEKWFNCYAPIYRPQPQPVASFFAPNQRLSYQIGGGSGGIPPQSFPRMTGGGGPQIMTMSTQFGAPNQRLSYQIGGGGGGPPPPPSYFPSSTSSQSYYSPPAPAYSLRSGSSKNSLSESYNDSRYKSTPSQHLSVDSFGENLMDFEAESADPFEEEVKSDEFKKSSSKKMKRSSSTKLQKEKAKPQLNQHEQLGNLIAQQSSQGMFNFNQALAKAIGIDFSLLQNALNDSILQSISNNIREQVWATVLALEYLKKKLGNLVDEWEMAEKKARKWLVSQKVDLSPLSTKASQLIQ